MPRRITAIRETIEESAVAAGLAGPIDPALGPRLQADLLAGTPFDQLLADHRLTLDLDALTAVRALDAHVPRPRRFDTLFFLAPALPGDWQPLPQPGECQAAEWATASALLDRIAAGQASAIFPTKRNLERIALHAGIDEAVADARHSLDTIVPWIEQRDGVRLRLHPRGSRLSADRRARHQRAPCLTAAHRGCLLILALLFVAGWFGWANIGASCARTQSSPWTDSVSPTRSARSPAPSSPPSPAIRPLPRCCRRSPAPRPPPRRGPDAAGYDDGIRLAGRELQATSSEGPGHRLSGRRALALGNAMSSARRDRHLEPA